MSLTEKVSLMGLFRIIKIKILRFKLLSVFLVFLLLIVTPVSANEIGGLNQANTYLKQARDLRALDKPQEAQEALQKAKEKIHTTLLAKTLKNEEIKQAEKEIEELRQAVKTPEPQYSVVIKSVPIFNYGFVTFEATIKNIAVTPYITNFGLYDCNLIDSKNNKYSGSFYVETVFNQAILPNKSQDFVIKDEGMSLSGLDNTTGGFKKCFYDDKGYKRCDLIDDLTIIDCVGYGTNNGKQASNGWGENPVKITFPLPVQPNSPTPILTPTPTSMPISENDPSYVYDPYYPIILSLSDDKGGQIKYSEHNQYPYSSTNTGITLKVGDGIKWEAEASDPKGRQISYSFTSNSQRFTDLFGREDGNCKYTTNNEAEFTITEEDLREVGETLRIVLNIRSEKDSYRVGGECGYDDSTYLDYKIQPD